MHLILLNSQIKGYDFGPIEVTGIPSKCNEMPFNDNSTRQDIE